MPDTPEHTRSTPPQRPLKWLRAALMTAAAAVLTACQIAPQSPSIGKTPADKASPSYRKQVALHLYERNSNRIYKGMLPPMLYAIGVLQVQIDGQGRVKNLNWMRKPSHAPEVVAEIERSVRAAAPFPTSGQSVTYTDTWLWDKSGRFQLDTLTEGQRGE
ncbi:hypothetical protein KUF54_16700 [Comamonas sp. Y33R10-2]|uniref:hypothetical protein n=1 Tax=Comamonas sp. Y33R10-2 TaxID=2853257 RepID=UPI001C5CA5B8|nr:hypothetical protein [Comamonas sp. Y33R10-2]QXZ09612.1 hypothetical protein KUF54_16700 [Comamonas sp. Y33R10-2]